MDRLNGLLIDDLQDLLHAEMQLVEALPKMAESAHHPKLREAFEKHLTQTRGQVERLKKAFELLGEKAQPKPCKGMQGLIEEGEEVIERYEGEDEIVADLAVISAAQKVEHYEIAAYGTARALARQIGEREVAALLSHSRVDTKIASQLGVLRSDSCPKPIRPRCRRGGGRISSSISKISSEKPLSNRVDSLRGKKNRLPSMRLLGSDFADQTGARRRSECEISLTGLLE